MFGRLFVLSLTPFETSGSSDTKFHIKAYERMGMKNYTNKLGHMTRMASMSIYGKIFKHFFPASMVRWPWNLVCSIGYQSSTVVQRMVFG